MKEFTKKQKIITAFLLVCLLVYLLAWKVTGEKPTGDCSKSGFSELRVSSTSREGNVVLDCDEQRKRQGG